MSLFDTVYVDPSCPGFTCSEGHHLEHFQSKDFGCTDGHVSIYFDDTVGRSNITFQDGGYGDGGKALNERAQEGDLLGRFSIYTTCEKCPAFVQAGTGNVCGVWVEYRVEVVDGWIRVATLISDSTPFFLENEPKLPHMVGCDGPMSYEDAERRSAEIRRNK